MSDYLNMPLGEKLFDQFDPSGAGLLFVMGEFFLVGLFFGLILKYFIFHKGIISGILKISLIVVSVFCVVLFIEYIRTPYKISGQLGAGFGFGLYTVLRSIKPSQFKLFDSSFSQEPKINIIKKPFLQNNIFSNFNLNQKISLAILTPVLFAFIWYGIAEFLTDTVIGDYFEFDIGYYDYMTFGPWWYWSVYLIIVIYFEIKLLGSNKED